MALAKQPLTGKRSRSCICQDAEMYPKKSLEALQGVIPVQRAPQGAPGQCAANQKGDIISKHGTTESTILQSIPTEQPLLYHTLQRRNRKQCRRNQQEHEAVSSDSCIPEGKTNSLYLVYPQGRLSGHLSTARPGSWEELLHSKGSDFGQMQKSASWELKLDPLKHRQVFFTESSKGAAPQVTLTNCFGQLFWVLFSFWIMWIS